MNELQRAIADFVRAHWPSKRAAFAASVALVALAVILLAGLDLSKVSRGEWGIVGGIFALPWVAWVLTKRVPKHPKDSIGFGIAISFEDSKQEARLRSDLVAKLESLLLNRPGPETFHVISFSPSLSRGVKDKASADALVAKSRSHFLIHGQAKPRDVNGQPIHFLELEGLVRHAAVAEAVNEFETPGELSLLTHVL